MDDYNKVLLNSGAIDTQTAAAQALRSTPAAGAGKDMRLIQFAGPIRPEWYQALQATGVRIVTYIPNNAYLVYGTPQTLQAVQQLALTNSAIAQWEGAYTAAARLDPAVTAQTNALGSGISLQQRQRAIRDSVGRRCGRECRHPCVD